MSASARLERTVQLLRNTRAAYDAGATNISRLENDKARYRASLSDMPWTRFVQCADYSYFTARVLLAQYVYLYGLFCAHQCVEVYLKAYLRKQDAPIPQTHRLIELLSVVRGGAPSTAEFLHHPEVETVCLRYDPFYELARYPAQITRPEGGLYIWGSGMDEQFLDYFVNRMRGLLPLPDGGWDILSEAGHEDLFLAKQARPEVLRLFKHNNANFDR